MKLNSKTTTGRFFIFGFAIILLFSLFGPLEHDYTIYVRIWDALKSGDTDFVREVNAYGVTFNYFSYLDFTRTVAIPRFIFTLFYLVGCVLLWSLAKTKISFSISPWIAGAILLLNPIFLLFGLKYGSNDLFVAGIFVMILYFNQKSEIRFSAILMAIGVSFKFIPLFLAPFLIISRFKINWKYFFYFLFSLAFITFLGYLKWGASVIEPIQLGDERISKMFSIFRFIRGSYNPMGGNLDHLSTFLVIGSAVITFGFYIYYQLDKYLMGFLCLSLVILLYKVGHHQFYLPYLLFYCFIVIQNHKLLFASKSFVVSSAVFWAWIFGFTLLYDFSFGYGVQYSIVRELLGLPTFLIHGWFILTLIFLIRKKHLMSTS